jgi:hypothetical protein
MKTLTAKEAQINLDKLIARIVDDLEPTVVPEKRPKAP